MPLVHSPILPPSAYVYDIRAVSDGWMIIVVDMMRSTERLHAAIDLSGCGGSVKCLWKHRGSSPISCFVLLAECPPLLHYIFTHPSPLSPSLSLSL